jgi:hypothetical protein
MLMKSPTKTYANGAVFDGPGAGLSVSGTSSPLFPGEDLADAFGGTAGSPEQGNLIFNDSGVADNSNAVIGDGGETVDFIRWTTSQDVTLRGYVPNLLPDGATTKNNRATELVEFSVNGRVVDLFDNDGQASAPQRIFAGGNVTGHDFQIRLTRSRGSAQTPSSGPRVVEIDALVPGGTLTAGGAPVPFGQTLDKTIAVVAPLRASADAHVRDGSFASTNYGAATSLEIKKSTTGYNRESYLRFDLSSTGPVGTAKLRLYGGLESATAPALTVAAYSVANTTWTEGGITWNNKPASGATLLASVPVSGAPGWREWDVSSYVGQQKAAGATSVSFVLRATASSDPRVLLNSDEAASNRPQLVLTPAVQGLVVSSTTLSVPEGTSRTFTVKLAVQPSANVSVQIAKQSGGDPDLKAAVSTLTFTPANWSTAQSVNVSAAEDVDATNGSAVFTVSSSGLASKTVTATEADNDVVPKTLRAVADAFVRDGTTYAGTNFGSAATIEVKKSTTGFNREAYLRFDLGTVSTITSAKLRLFGKLNDTAVATLQTAVYSMSDVTWGESTITWNNKPTAPLTSRGTITVGGTTAKWYELDLTSFLKSEKAAGRNLVTLVLKNLATSSTLTTFNSDEAATARPELSITP